MFLFGFLAVLLCIVLGAVYSAFQDLRARDRQQPPVPPAMPPETGVWPPPPKI